MQELLEKVCVIAQKAGNAIMEVYESDDFDIQTKSDDSPVTAADHAANEIIVGELSKIANYDVISEEGEHIAKTEKFWLVDPLDGTKEFIKQNGEFTVNIALVEDSEPILGVVYVPAKGVLYAGARALGAWKVEKGQKSPIKSDYKNAVPTVVVSRSHRDEKMDKLLKAIGEHKEVSMGSSLKLCLIAEGKAQLYPRLAPTMLWDTAAADAIVRAAGGTVRSLTGQPLSYSPQKNLRNPFFVAHTGNDKLLEKYKRVLVPADA